MANRANPLLVALRAATPDLKCYRTYTTAYKAGGYRVKLYGCTDTSTFIWDKALAKAGFKDISYEQLDGGSCYSVVIKATRR